VGPPCGFGFTGSNEGRDNLRALLQDVSQRERLQTSLFPELRVENEWDGKGVDITPLIEKFNVPGIFIA
jgi:uncharacterized protein YfeS